MTDCEVNIVQIHILRMVRKLKKNKEEGKEILISSKLDYEAVLGKTIANELENRLDIMENL